MNQIGIVYIKDTEMVRRVIVPDISFEYHKLAPDEKMLIVTREQFAAVGNSISAAMATYK